MIVVLFSGDDGKKESPYLATKAKTRCSIFLPRLLHISVARWGTAYTYTTNVYFLGLVGCNFC